MKAPSETRTGTIARHVDHCIRSTQLTWEAFGETVAEHYHERTPLDMRRVKMCSDRDAVKRIRLNAQTVRRHLDGTTPLAADLEESIVAALPTFERIELERALLRRRGYLAVKISECDENAVICLETLAREVGDVFQALAPILADGKLDEEDREHIPLAVKELLDLEAVARSAREKLQAVKDSNVTVWPVVRGESRI